MQVLHHLIGLLASLFLFTTGAAPGVQGIQHAQGASVTRTWKKPGPAGSISAGYGTLRI
jgi:hypothetical protein